MQKYFNYFLDEQGNRITSASVLVKTNAGSAATIYSDNSGTITANPLTTDGSGYFEFYATNGTYTLELSKTGYATVSISAVLLDDPAEYKESVNVKWFGAKGDETTDDTAAIQDAIDYLVSLGTGGRLFFPAGGYRVTSTINVDADGIVLAGEVNAGWYRSTSRPKGSFFLVGANIAGDVLVFGSGSTNYYGGGVEDIGFADVGTGGSTTLRNYAVTGAALHVKNCDGITLRNLRFQGIRGSALKMGRSVKSCVSDIDIAFCGATGQPSMLTSGGVAPAITQATIFSSVRVEYGCGGAAHLSVGATDVNNKFIGFGFETATFTSSQGAETNDGVFLEVLGDENHFSEFHFNRHSAGGSNPRVSVSGSENLFSNFKFAGARPGTDIYLNNAQQNVFVGMSDIGVVGNAALWMIDMAGSSTLNLFDNIYGAYTSGINIASTATNNIVKSAQFRLGSGSALTCAGTGNVLDVYATGMTTTTTLFTISGARNNTKVTSIANTAVASEVVLVSGGYSDILSGSKIYNSQSAHGIRVTANYGRFDGIEVLVVGKTGIMMDGGQPASVSNNTVVDAGQATAATYYGISFESGTTLTIGGVCNNNRVVNTIGSLANSIFVTDNAGSPRYDYWTFVGNNTRNGGAVSISTGNNIIASNVA